jgi:transcriptional regulator with XRE-family HTH domain
MLYGQRIRAAREARGVSQFDLGQMIGRRDGDISRWERGALVPKVSTLVDISAALGVALEYLAGVNEEMGLVAEWSDPRDADPGQLLAQLPKAPPVEPSPPAAPRKRSMKAPQDI